MPSVFTKIIQGEIPSYKIGESENCFAFLDISPLAEGHALVVPKKEVDYIFDLDEALYSELMLFSKRVAAALRKSVPCKRIGVAVIGLEVPHAHVHLIPMNSVSDLNFARPKLSLPKERMEELCKGIVENFI